MIAAPFLAHLAIATGHHLGLAEGLAVIQALAIAVMARRARGWPMRMAGLSVTALLLTALALRAFWPGFAAPDLLLTSGASHTLMYGGLLAVFGLSLRPRHTDVVTGIALRLNDARTPAIRGYTRGVTWAWCGFFAAQLLTSAGLLVWAPHWAWSLFVNVLDGPLVVLMFAAEYAVRCLRFRGQAHVSPMQIWRTYLRRTDPSAG